MACHNAAKSAFATPSPTDYAEYSGSPDGFCHSAAQQCLPVRAKMRWLERHALHHAAGQFNRRGVAIVARVKTNHLITRTHRAVIAAYSASVAPAVTVISLFASGLWPYNSAVLSAMASRNVCTPVIGAYWLAPCATWYARRSCKYFGPSKSGKPCERLMALCCCAGAHLRKIVVPRLGSLLCGINGLCSL